MPNIDRSRQFPGRDQPQPLGSQSTVPTGKKTAPESTRCGFSDPGGCILPISEGIGQGVRSTLIIIGLFVGASVAFKVVR